MGIFETGGKGGGGFDKRRRGELDKDSGWRSTDAHLETFWRETGDWEDERLAWDGESGF
jgi:hypothetical protein